MTWLSGWLVSWFVVVQF